MAKNGQVHEGRKVGRSSATPIKPFSVNSYDLKSMSFKFGNDIFITFEMPRSSFTMIFWKITFRCYSVHLYSEVLGLVMNDGSSDTGPDSMVSWLAQLMLVTVLS